MKEAVFSSTLRCDMLNYFSEDKYEPHVYLIQNAYKTGKKPYDFYFVRGDYFVAVECKVIKNSTLNFNHHIRSHQISYLQDVENAGRCGFGFFFIYVDNMKRFLAIRVGTLKKMMRTCSNNSIKLTDVLDTYKDEIAVCKREKIRGQTMWNLGFINDKRFFIKGH